jgi:Flp pilus assembly secretin CpaC
MSFSSLRTRARACFGFRSLAVGILLWPAAAFAAPPTEAIGVNVDQARLFKLPGKVATIVIGNPMIADVALQTGGVVVVTGKGYGATNFIAMDRSGEVLVDRLIEVTGPADHVVTVYRGLERETYSCMPNCEHRVTLGDSDKYLKSSMDQVQFLNNATSSAAAQAGRVN